MRMRVACGLAVVLALSLSLSLSLSCSPERREPSRTPLTSASEPHPVATVNRLDLRPPRALQTVPSVTFARIGLGAPQAVIHDAQADVYLVTNEALPTFIPEEGPFISRLAPDGHVIALRWIEDGKNGVTLSSPKGLAISGDLIYVADVNTVRSFDRMTGAPAALVRIPGASDLTDVVAAPDGRVLASDGVEHGAIFAIDSSHHVSTLAAELVRPRAMLRAPAGLWVTSGTGALSLLDPSGRTLHARQLPVDSLDGVVSVDDELIISSSGSSRLLRGAPAGDFRVILGNITAPADIGLDTKRQRVLVPFPRSSAVEAFDLRMSEVARVAEP